MKNDNDQSALASAHPRRAMLPRRQALIGGPAGAMPDPLMAKKLEDLREAARNREYRAALAALRELIDRAPDRRALLDACDITRMIRPDGVCDQDVLCELIDVSLSVDADAAAEAAARRLLSLRHGDLDSAYYDIAKLYFSRGRHREALMAIVEAHRINQRSNEITFFLGVTYQHFGLLGAAARAYEELLERNPAHTGALLNLAVCHNGLGDPERAVALLERVLAHDANNEVAVTNLIMCLAASGATARAHSLLSDFETRAPYASDAVFLRAFLHERGGRPRAAVDLLAPVVAATGRPQHVVVYGRAAKQLASEDVGRHLTALQAWKAKMTTKMSASELRAVTFVLGDLHERMGEYDAAFQCYREANSIAPPSFARQPMRQLLNAVRSFDADAAKVTLDSPARRLVFVVGMPRSGTSLLEQIVTMSADVYGAGERPTIGRIARQISPGDIGAYPFALQRLSCEEKLAYANSYLEQFRRIAPHRCVMDKMPSNFQFVGLIATLFPGAKIIHMRRDWMDTCLSCYCHEFSGRHPYKYRLADLGFYYRIQEEMMRHWKGVCNGRILEVRYEDLVLRFEDTVSEIFEFIEVETPTNCRDFQANNNQCLTSSYFEVRRPIYTTSMGRWRKYARYLSELDSAD